MAFTKLTKSVLNVSALPDRVNNQAQLLKATFDQAGVDIKEAHNTLIDELESDNSAEYLGAKSQTGETSNIQQELNTLNALIEEEKSNVDAEFEGKVDKIDGKQLSTEDYTTEEKNKLSNIEENANNYVLPEASTTVMGGVKVDGKTIVVENGVAKAKGSDAADYTARADIEVLKETKADKSYVVESVGDIQGDLYTVDRYNQIEIVEDEKGIPRAWEYSMGVSYDIKSVTKAKGLYVMVGSNGKIVVNTVLNDPTSNQYITSSQASSTFNKVIYVEDWDLFIAGGSYGVIETSPDGINWTARNSGFGTTSSHLVNGLAYGNGKCIAVGSHGMISFSEDGINWTRANQLASYSINDVLFKDGKFYLCEIGKIYVTEDGTSYDTKSFDDFTHAFNGIAESNGMIIATGSEVHAEGYRLAISYDGGITFNLYKTNLPNKLNKIQFDPISNRFIAVYNDRDVAFSEDGVNWIIGKGIPYSNSNSKVETLFNNDGEICYFYNKAIYTPKSPNIAGKINLPLTSLEEGKIIKVKGTNVLDIKTGEEKLEAKDSTFLPRFSSNSVTDDYGTWRIKCYSEPNSSYPLYYAFDRSSSDYYLDSNVPAIGDDTHYIQITVPEETTHKISICPSKFYIYTKQMKNGRLYGKNEETGEWELLVSGCNNTTTSSQYNEKDITTDKFYTAFKFVYNQYSSSNTDTYIYSFEFKSGIIKKTYKEDVYQESFGSLPLKINNLPLVPILDTVANNEEYSLVLKNGSLYPKSGAKFIYGSFKTTKTNEVSQITLPFTPDFVILYSNNNNATDVATNSTSATMLNVPKIISKAYSGESYTYIFDGGFQTRSVTAVTTNYIAIKL